MTAPAHFPRRSFVYRQLIKAGPSFEPLSDSAVALDFGHPDAEAEAARRLGLADLSPLPRAGFKGAGTVEWLEGKKLAVPAESNRALRQKNGALAARLAPAEVLILGGLGSTVGGLPVTLNAAWAAEPLPPAVPRGYPVPRQDSHAWFLIAGERAAAMFAKLCAVDLRPGKFDDLAIAQTSVARLSAIVIRDDRGATPAYHLLADSASAPYLWDVLLDAMAEFDGRLMGLTAARTLGRS